MLSGISGFIVSISIYKGLTIVLKHFYQKELKKTQRWKCVFILEADIMIMMMTMTMRIIMIIDHGYDEDDDEDDDACDVALLGLRVDLNPLSLGAIPPRDRQLPSLLFSFFLSPLVSLVMAIMMTMMMMEDWIEIWMRCCHIEWYQQSTRPPQKKQISKNCINC